MKEFKGTPGPWFVKNTADIFTDLGAKNSEGAEASQNDGWHVADCDMGGLCLEEVVANAHLIAAAPELLEALQAVIPYVVIDTVECRGDKCRDRWCISCCGEEDAEIAAADAAGKLTSALSAIAKALGEDHG